MPRRVKVAVAFAGLCVLSPIDVIPEFLPVIGPLDDVVVVALRVGYAAPPHPHGSARGSPAGRTLDPRSPRPGDVLDHHHDKSSMNGRQPVPMDQPAR